MLVKTKAPLPNGHGSPRRFWAINSNTAVGCMMAALLAALIGLTPALAGPSYGPLARPQDHWRVPQLYSPLQHVIPLHAVSPIAKRPNCTCPRSILPDQAGTANFSASLCPCRLRTPGEPGPGVEGRRVLERPRPRRRLLQWRPLLKHVSGESELRRRGHSSAQDRATSRTPSTEASQ